MLKQIFTRRSAAVAAAVAVAMVACSPNDGPLAPRATSLTTSLALSATSERAGGHIAVDIRNDGAAEPIGSLEGTLRFDPSHLRYVGQYQSDGTILFVNATHAASGELRVAELDPTGLAPRKAVLVFEALSTGPVGYMRYQHRLAAINRTLAEIKSSTDGGVTVDPTLIVPSGARMMDLADWKAEAARMDAARGARNGGPVALRPGQYVLNLQYGDVNLDGSVNVTDAISLLNLSIGLGEIITGTDTAPTIRDAVIAGNVAPYNVGGPLLPGDEADGTRVVNTTDALAVINEAVFANQPVVGDLIPGRGPPPAGVVPVLANITVNTLWTKNNVYRLKGLIRVNNGATLTIEAGTRVEGDSATSLAAGDPTALFIERDGRIIADGTRLEPIVFTCQAAVKFKGCWGGLWIAGNAPMNSFGSTSIPPTPTNPAIAGRTAAGCMQALGEAGAPLYGGCNPDDSSGVIRYVRVEFGGFVTSVANVELNNLSLGGVGRKTVMDYIQVFGGSDDGIELFGGSVDMKHLLIEENRDDQLDYAEGYIGRVQFIITREDPQDGDKGFEIDNTPSAPFTLQNPWGTYAEVWNATIIGKLASDPLGTGPSVVGGIHVRRGTKTSLRNLLVYGFPSFVVLDQVETCQTDANGAKLVIQNSYFSTAFVSNVLSTVNPCQGQPATAFLTDPVISGGTNTIMTNENPFYPSSVRVSQALQRNQPDYRPRSDMDLTTKAANPVSRFLTITAVGGTGPVQSLTRPEFFDNTAKYQGALPAADPAKSVIPWYSGWTRTGNSP